MSDSGRISRADSFRATIAGFIEARRDAKLKGKEGDASDTADKYVYGTWLADAARRVNQIQLVTHVLKATHPDAKGSNLHVVPQSLHAHTEIGSHVLGERFDEDVVGNAAALDVFKFLKVEVEGRTLLNWMQLGDEALREALHPDPAIAAEWMAAFGGLVRTDLQPSSHGLAKQVYWLVEHDPSADDGYHLLQPLFSSSLAHAVHADINDARFGETNKALRKAKRENQLAEGVYRDYRDLVVRKLGGTKPQNISQLNSERGGVNYLLDSTPPRWRQSQSIQLQKVNSVFDRLIQFDGTRKLVKVLAKFLRQNPDPNMVTRNTREAIEQAIGLQLITFMHTVRSQVEPGWSRDADCALPLCQQFWLDGERIDLPVRDTHKEEDEAFNAGYQKLDWPDEVASFFARWLNQRLLDAGVVGLGDVEYRHWAKQAIVDAAWPAPMQRRAEGVAA